jgi:hypothetical protein
MAERSRGRGWYDFAGAMFGIVGMFNGIQGLSAIFKKEYFSEEALVYQNLQLWGWIWLIVGVVQIGAAISLFSGRGRTLGIVLAALSAVVSFASIGAYPLWSIAVIAIDILIIPGLTLHAPAEYETDLPRGSTGDDMRPPIMQR